VNEQEFKAWFDGFAAAITDAPTPAQWEIIKKQAAATGADPFRGGYAPYVWTHPVAPFPDGTITCSK
jgi:hypothetical protein